MTTQAIRDAIGLVIDGGLDPSDLQWFDVSALDDGPGERDFLMECRPPFERNFVVYRGPSRNHVVYDLMMIVAGQDPHEGIVVTMWKGPYGQMPKDFPMLVYAIDGDVIKYGPANENDQMDEDVARTILGLLSKWYAAMSAGCEMHSPRLQPTWTNRRKIAAGKAPTYDWRTVVIKPAQSKAEPQGGTHASPRLHDRRGHLRRLRSGKNVWVRPCKVGDASLGAVFKDYEVAA